MKSEIRILFVDDHEVFHECMRAFFAMHEGMTIIATANNGQSAVELAGELNPDVVMMDMAIPVLHGIEATAKIVEANPGMPVIILSGHSESSMVLEAFRAGAKGYVLKDESFSELIQAVHTVLEGYFFLSPKISDIDLDGISRSLSISEKTPSLDSLSQREIEVLKFLAEGKNVKEIATSLNVSVKTIESHRSNLMKKLGLYSLPELTKFAVRNGLASLSI